MNILVTGGSGFIGMHVVRLLKNEHKMSIFDYKKSEIAGIKSFVGDMLNQNEIDDATKDCNIVIHLAAMVGVKETEENPLKTLDVNIKGTENTLESCRKNDVKKIIFSSSSEVYGEPEKVPVSEENRLNPKSAYGVAKIACEEYIKAYQKTYGISFSILRFFNVYGPGQRLEFVIPKLVKLAIEHKPLTIYGDGSQVRAFCHVSDVANAIYLTLTKGDNEILNIGNDKEPISIKNLAELIIKQTNSDSQIKFTDFSKTERSQRREIFRRIPSIEKAKRLLGYEPNVYLNDGLKSVIDYIKGLKV